MLRVNPLDIVNIYYSVQNKNVLSNHCTIYIKNVSGWYFYFLDGFHIPTFTWLGLFKKMIRAFFESKREV